MTTSARRASWRTLWLSCVWVGVTSAGQAQADVAEPVALPQDGDARAAVDHATAGPTVELPDDGGDSAPATARPPSSTDAAPSPAPSGTSFGGYGQVQATFRRVGNGGRFDGEATVRRVVLFVQHRFTETVRSYVELEWENALACSTCRGIVEVEQAFLEARTSRAFGVRGGLVLVPMGIVNQWHEPTAFHGVERPAFDALIIPSTWRAIGAGIFGQPTDALRYELYAMTSFDPTGFGPNGFAGGRTLGSLSPANGLALTGRLELEPIVGLTFGASGYLSESGGNVDAYRDAEHRASLSIPVLGWSLDGRYKRGGVEARFVVAQFFSPGSGELMRAERQDGSAFFPSPTTNGVVPSRIEGGYVELAYDVLHFVHTTHQLLPFVRLERYDTQAAVPAGFTADPTHRVNELTTGLTYRPLPSVVLKTDVQLRDRARGRDELLFAVGLGYVH